jgi:hypothetical protein
VTAAAGGLDPALRGGVGGGGASAAAAVEVSAAAQAAEVSRSISCGRAVLDF